MVELLRTRTRRKQKIPSAAATVAANFKSIPATNPSKLNWTHHLLDQSKPIRLRRQSCDKLADLIVATGGTLLPPPPRIEMSGNEMLQERLDDVRQVRRPRQVDAHEKCCRPAKASTSIIINQNDDREPETAATSGERHEDEPPPPLLATSDMPRRRNRQTKRQLDKNHLHQHHLHLHLHHCQTISSNDSARETMRPVKKLTRHHKLICDGRWRQRQQQQPALMIAAICLAAAVSCALIGLCDCDSESASARLRPAERPPQLISSHQSQQRTTRRHTDSSSSSDATVAPSRRADLPNTTTAKTRDQTRKQELMSSMAETIERQHWALSSRPNARVHSLAGAQNEFLSKQIIASHEAKGRQPQSAKTDLKSVPLSSPTTSKVELDLSRIMMMHEIDAATSATKKLAPGQPQDVPKSSQASKTTRWLSSGQSPVKLLNQPTGGGNILTGVMSSLLAPASLSTGPKGDHKVVNATHNANSFTPRANAKNYLMGPILGLGQMLMQTGSSPFSHHSEASSIDQSVYSKPANSFLSFTSPRKSAPGGAASASYQKTKQLLGTGGAAGDAHLSTNESSPPETSGRPTAPVSLETGKDGKRQQAPVTTGGWIKNGANQLAHSYFQDSLRGLLTLSQLPILSAGPVSTAPSDLEPGGKKWLADRAHAQRNNNKNNRTQLIDDLLRYAYILGNVGGARRKRDPLKALGSLPASNAALALASHDTRRPLLRPLGALNSLGGARRLSSMLLAGPNRGVGGGGDGGGDGDGGGIKPRGVMWDMATDPTLAVTVFHLLERASAALPLGFLLMPFVHMIRNPFAGGAGVNLARILPARASHRSVDYEELAKRIDMMDKILSRAMRPTHREA